MGSGGPHLTNNPTDSEDEQATRTRPAPGTRPTRDEAGTQQPIPSRFPEDRSLEDDVGNWWVMHVKPNCEKMVARYFLNRSISYYLPLYERQRRTGYFKRVRTAMMPLFGGYICFALEKSDHKLLYDSKKFVRIITVDDQEAFVSELSAVSRAIASGEELSVQPGLVPGRKVLILSGTLEGTEGVIVRRGGHRKLVLSVQMFNQSVVLNLDPVTMIEAL